MRLSKYLIKMDQLNLQSCMRQRGMEVLLGAIFCCYEEPFLTHRRHHLFY